MRDWGRFIKICSRIKLKASRRIKPKILNGAQMGFSQKLEEEGSEVEKQGVDGASRRRSQPSAETQSKVVPTDEVATDKEKGKASTSAKGKSTDSTSVNIVFMLPTEYSIYAADE